MHNENNSNIESYDVDINNNSCEEKKDERIKISLEAGNSSKTVVLAKPTAKASKLLKAYCAEHNVGFNSYRLIYKGKVLKENDAISDYNLKDGDTINVVAVQTGGCL